MSLRIFFLGVTTYLPVNITRWEDIIFFRAPGGLVSQKLDFLISCLFLSGNDILGFLNSIFIFANICLQFVDLGFQSSNCGFNCLLCNEPVCSFGGFIVLIFLKGKCKSSLNFMHEVYDLLNCIGISAGSKSSKRHYDGSVHGLEGTVLVKNLGNLILDSLELISLNEWGSSSNSLDTSEWLNSISNSNKSSVVLSLS